MAASNETEPSTTKQSDPAHPSQANHDHTNKDGEKPTTAFDVITDTSFVPTLDEAPKTQQAKSHGLLLFLVVGAVLGAWLFGFELFQVGVGESYTSLILVLGSTSAILVGALVWTGTMNIDWWEVVAGYWWLSLPVAGAAGLALVMMQEQATGWDEVE